MNNVTKIICDKCKSVSVLDMPFNDSASYVGYCLECGGELMAIKSLIMEQVINETE